MMVDNRSGLLRFNIAEKIRLADNAASIQALEEVELVPEVEVNIRGEHAILKGYLLLTGSYAGADVAEDSSVRSSNESCRMEHRIPVEITLPVSRISEEDNILIEIDNFDVDVVDPRSIMVTGSLVLSGIDTSPDTPVDPDRAEDEMVFVDIAKEIPQEEKNSEESFYARLSQPKETGAVHRTESEIAQKQGSNRTRIDEKLTAEPVRNFSNHIGKTDETVQSKTDVVEVSNDVEEAAVEDREEQQAADASGTFDQEKEDGPGDQSEADSGDREPEVEAKKEMKIAFGAKKKQSDNNEPIHLPSAFAHKPIPRPGSSEEEQELQEDEAGQGENNYPRESTGETLDWARMLRSGEDLPSSSHKLRIGLAQNDDTLESVGQRFGVNPKELALLNKLDIEGELRPGQTIFIPNTKPASLKEEEGRRKRKANG
jgi:stage VI sporulation protein D